MQLAPRKEYAVEKSLYSMRKEIDEYKCSLKETNSKLAKVQAELDEKLTGKKYKKLIIWDEEYKELLEIAARKSGMTVTAFIKKCVVDGLRNLNLL